MVDSCVGHWYEDRRGDQWSIMIPVSQVFESKHSHEDLQMVCLGLVVSTSEGLLVKGKSQSTQTMPGTRLRRGGATLRAEWERENHQ